MDAGDVCIWTLPLVATTADVAALEPRLDDRERARADAFRFAGDRARYVVAHALVREALSISTGVAPEALRFRLGPHGKPYLAGPGHVARLRFSLTHSGELALCATTLDREVGVDVERMRPGREFTGIAERFFSPAEVASLRALGPSHRPAAFYAGWTRKEAFLKATGEGLTRDLRSFDVSLGDPARLLRGPDRSRWTMRAVPTRPGYAAAIVVEGAVSGLRRETLTLPLVRRASRC